MPPLSGLLLAFQLGLAAAPVPRARPAAPAAVREADRPPRSLVGEAARAEASRSAAARARPPAARAGGAEPLDPALAALARAWRLEDAEVARAAQWLTRAPVQVQLSPLGLSLQRAF